MFHWTPRVQFTQRRQKFRRQCKKFPLKVRKSYKSKTLSKKSFSSKCCSGHVTCSCDNCRNFCAGSPKKMCFEWKHFSSKCSHGHVECSFDNLDEKFYQKSKTFPLQVRKNFVKIQGLSQRNQLLQNVSLDTQNAGLTTPTKKTRWECEKFLLNTRKR